MVCVGRDFKEPLVPTPFLWEGQLSLDQELPLLLSIKKIVPGALLCSRVFEQAEGNQGCLCSRAASLRMHPAQNLFL